MLASPPTALKRPLPAALLLAVGLALAGCGGPVKHTASNATAAAAGCPVAWQPGWQTLARRIGAPVYCPAWMPSPLDGQIGGEWNGLESVDKHGGYLVSFVYQETGSGEVHVTFHRWPGTRMPLCQKETSHVVVACYSDPGGHVRVNGIDATLYTVSRGTDQWHLSYLWRHDGATYVVSEHVAPPYTFARVKQNVTRILRSLVILRPAA